MRLARTGGALLDVFALLGVVLYGVGPKLLCLFAAGAAFARMGGTWLHGVLPPMLREGRAPSQADCATAAGLGLFSLAGLLQSPSASLGIEWEIALENLAFCCTDLRRDGPRPGASVPYVRTTRASLLRTVRTKGAGQLAPAPHVQCARVPAYNGAVAPQAPTDDGTA